MIVAVGLLGSPPINKAAFWPQINPHLVVLLAHINNDQYRVSTRRSLPILYIENITVQKQKYMTPQLSKHLSFISITFPTKVL